MYYYWDFDLVGYSSTSRGISACWTNSEGETLVRRSIKGGGAGWENVTLIDTEPNLELVEAEVCTVQCQSKDNKGSIVTQTRVRNRAQPIFILYNLSTLLKYLSILLKYLSYIIRTISIITVLSICNRYYVFDSDLVWRTNDY